MKLAGGQWLALLPQGLLTSGWQRSGSLGQASSGGCPCATPTCRSAAPLPPPAHQHAQHYQLSWSFALSFGASHVEQVGISCGPAQQANPTVVLSYGMAQG